MGCLKVAARICSEKPRMPIQQLRWHLSSHLSSTTSSLSRWGYGRAFVDDRRLVLQLLVFSFVALWDLRGLCCLDETCSNESLEFGWA